MKSRILMSHVRLKKQDFCKKSR